MTPVSMDQIVFWATTLAIFAALLGVLVFAHELGHFLAARFFRMKVEEFAFGFGPAIFKRRRRNEAYNPSVEAEGTIYSVRALPLGGFVRIAGMDPTEEKEIEGGFNSKPIWNRALVILAGPFMSLMLGYIVFLLIGFVWGFATSTPTPRVYQVQKGSPAAVAGLRKGDVFQRIDGQTITKGVQVTTAIRASEGRPLDLQVLRDGKLVSMTASARLAQVEGEKEKVWLLGFSPEPEMRRAGAVESVKRGTMLTVGAVTGIVSTLFSKRVAKDVGGVVMIGYVTGQMVKEGAHSVFFELAMLSVMLAVLNLLPIPILDGGHLMYLALEKIRGKRLEPERWQAVQAAGLAFLLLVAVAVFVLDISRLANGKMP